MPMSGEATTNVEMASSEEMTMGKYASRERVASAFEVRACLRVTAKSRGGSTSRATAGRRNDGASWKATVSAFLRAVRLLAGARGNRHSGVSHCVERTCAVRVRDLRFVGVLREWK